MFQILSLFLLIFSCIYNAAAANVAVTATFTKDQNFTDKNVAEKVGISSFSGDRIIISAESVNEITTNPVNSAIIANDFSAKIAVVDIESIFEHSIAIKDMKTKINRLSDQIQQEMSVIESELKKTENDLIRQRSNIGEEDFDKKIKEFNQRVSRAQKLLQSRKAALEQARNNAITMVHNATIMIIADLAKERGFNFVLPATQVIFIDNKFNITLEVITRLNKQLTNIELEYDLK